MYFSTSGLYPQAYIFVKKFFLILGPKVRSRKLASCERQVVVRHGRYIANDFVNRPGGYVQKSNEES